MEWDWDAVSKSAGLAEENGRLLGEGWGLNLKSTEKYRGGRSKEYRGYGG